MAQFNRKEWTVFTERPKAQVLYNILQERILAEIQGSTLRVIGRNPFAFFRQRMFACVRIESTRQEPEGYVEVSFYLNREIDSPRLLDKLPCRGLGTSAWEYWLSITNREDIDEELMGWLAESYALVGEEKAVYEIRHFYEWWTGELWGANDAAKKKYGYPIDLDDLPLSEALKERILAMSDEHATCLAEYPPDPTPWTADHVEDFAHRAKEVYEQIKEELGPDFEVFYCVHVID